MPDRIVALEIHTGDAVGTDDRELALARQLVDGRAQRQLEAVACAAERRKIERRAVGKLRRAERADSGELRRRVIGREVDGQRLAGGLRRQEQRLAGGGVLQCKPRGVGSARQGKGEVGELAQRALGEAFRAQTEQQDRRKKKRKSPTENLFHSVCSCFCLC